MAEGKSEPGVGMGGCGGFEEKTAKGYTINTLSYLSQMSSRCSSKSAK